MKNSLAQLNSKQIEVNKLVRTCWTLVQEQHDKEQFQVSPTGCLNFFCQKAFREYYVLSNRLRNFDYKAYQSLHNTLKMAFNDSKG